MAFIIITLQLTGKYFLILKKITLAWTLLTWHNCSHSIIFYKNTKFFVFHWITIIRAASFFDLWWYAHHDDDMLMIAICRHTHTHNILINDYLIDYNDFITPVFPSESILLLFFILFWSSASNAHHLLDIFVPFLIFYYKFILIQLFLCFILYFIIVIRRWRRRGWWCGWIAWIATRTINKFLNT